MPDMPDRNDTELFQATEKAYDMVFKSIVDFSCIKAASDLGLFAHLAETPRDVETLAQITESVPERLEKFLITLQQIGLVQHQQNGAAGAWALTPFAARFFATPEAHRSLTMQPFVDYLAKLADTFYMRLADVVRGQLDFTSLVPHPPATREDSLFYETIHRSNIHFVIKLLQAHAHLDDTRHLLDVGGGIGDIAAALCERFPNLNVTLINLPSAITLINENSAARGLSERITPLSIDMYRDPYPACDALLFARILYPMNDQFCTMLCQKAYDALEPGGRILIGDLDISNAERPNYDYLTHYLCAIGMGFSVLEFKSHTIYPDVLQRVGFRDVQFNEAYDHVLYQARKPAV
jgi:bacteriochlorophyll C20 methyltransferase